MCDTFPPLLGVWIAGALVLAGACSTQSEMPDRADPHASAAARAQTAGSGAPTARTERGPIDNPINPPIVTGNAMGAGQGAAPPAPADRREAPSAESSPADRRDAPGTAAAPGAAATPPTASATREAFCNTNQRPAIMLPKAGATCAGKVASQAFRYAVCACNDLLVGGTLSTDGFDSRDDVGRSVEGGGALGVNGSFACSGFFEIGGSTTITGPNGWAINNLSSGPIQGDLRIAGPMTQDGTTTVARNAWLGGALTGAGSLMVSGDLRQSPGAARSVPMLDVRGGNLRESVTIDPPCACREDQVLDIPGIVDIAKADNDNIAAGFDPNALAHIVTSREVELPCGRLYVSELSVENTAATLTIKVTGRTALFVEGDVHTVGLLDIEMSPDAELDVFVRRGFTLAGIQSAGNMLKPANLRVYVGGSDGILLAGLTAFTGNLYAPHAMVTVGGIQDIYGAVFAGDFTAAGITNVHYDRAVIREGDDCTPPTQPPPEPPPPACTDCTPPEPPPECTDCSGCSASAACIAGRCGACRTDADCCQPLVCVDGSCSSLLL